VQIEALAWLPANAFHVAAATMTGQFLGAGDPRRAAHSGVVAAACGTSLLTIAATVFYLGGGLLTTFFTGDATDPTGRASADLLKIVCFATPSLGLLTALQGALRGAGDTRWSLGVTLAGLILLRLPLACWLAWEQIPLPFTDATVAGWELGVAGAWWAMVSDVIFRSGLVLLRFLHGGWKGVTV
jgi:Na+-driven multidrug efflux pump